MIRVVVPRPQVGIPQRGIILLPREPVLGGAVPTAAADRPEYVVLVARYYVPRAVGQGLGWAWLLEPSVWLIRPRPYT